MNIAESINSETICINASTKELVKVRSLVERFTEDMGFSEDKSFKIQLVVDEICTNIIKHGYNQMQIDTDNKSKSICIVLIAKESSLLIRIIDQGPTFNPVEYQAPDIHNHISHPHKGGLGIPLIKLLSDKISFSIINGKQQKNLLEIEFNLV